MTNFSNSDHSATVVYRRPGDSTQYYEVTQNVPATVSYLEAQGFIIIDIIHDDRYLPAVMG